MSSTAAATPSWWEKTVEYTFIQQAIRKWGVSFVAWPGVQAAAAPGGFSLSDCKWLLIEFKKDKHAIDSVKSRFYDYDISRSVIEQMEKTGEVQSHLHRVVYGKTDKQGRFCLGASPYWPTAQAREQSKPSFLENGAHLQAFINYLEILMPMQNPASRENIGAAIIMGVHRQNRQCICLTLEEFFRQLRLTAAEPPAPPQKPEPAPELTAIPQPPAPELKPEPKPQPPATPQPPAQPPGPPAQTTPHPAAQATQEPETETGLEPELNQGPEPEPEPETELGLELEPEPEPKPETEQTLKPPPEAEAESAFEVELEFEAEIEAEPETKPPAAPEAKPQPESVRRSEEEPATRPAPETVPNTEPPPAAATQQAPEPEKTEPAPPAESTPALELAPEPEPEPAPQAAAPAFELAIVQDSDQEKAPESTPESAAP